MEKVEIDVSKRIVYIYKWKCPNCGKDNILETSTTPTCTSYIYCNCNEVLTKQDRIFKKE